MNELSEYLSEIDKSISDQRDSNKIEKRLIEIRNTFEEKQDIDNAQLAQLEIEVLNLIKAVRENGVEISWMLKGSRKNEFGEDVEVLWPDVDKYDSNKFARLKERFETTNSAYLKSQYGLVLLFAKESKYKDDNTALKVLESLKDLMNLYYEIVKDDKEDSQHLAFEFLNLVKIYLVLTQQRRKNRVEFLDEYNFICNFIIELISTWDVEHRFFRIITDLAEIMNTLKIDLEESDKAIILDKIWEITLKLKGKMLEISIEHALVGDKLANRYGMKDNKWLEFAASNYMEMADQASVIGDDLMSNFYVEKSLRIYKLMKDVEEIRKAEKRFEETKRKGGLNTIRTPIPDEAIQDLEMRVNSFLETASVSDVLQVLIDTPMIPKVEDLISETKRMYEVAPLTSMLSRSVRDKMGNTILEFNHEDKDGIFNANFLENYSLMFQIASDELWYFFTSSLLVKKIDYEAVESQIKNSWLGKEFSRLYNGVPWSIVIFDSIKESLRALFEYISSIVVSGQNQPIESYIPSIDSLTLKFEYAFRYLCERLQIPTYAEDRSTKALIKVEKSINALLTDKLVVDMFKKSSLEDDLWLFRYIMIEKMGWNLRNRIAHSIMDPFEYNFRQCLLLIVLFLKLSSYNFKNK